MFNVDKELVDKAADKGDSSEELAQIFREHPKAADAYEAFMGQIRHKGKHAGGVIITETPVPVERMGDEVGAAWSEGFRNELSYAGIVKFDLLGLSALSALNRLENTFGVRPPKPTNGAPAFEIFREGDLSGIFQFSGSDGIRDLTMRLKPDSLGDLVAINALYRPGAIDAGSMEKYPEWKERPREVPDYIADILEETYGAIVYQEQFMSIFQRTVGGSFGEADTARRVITKAKPGDPHWLEKVERLRGRFIRAAQEDHHLSKVEATNLWRELETHSRYSFNKAHSTAYSMIAWECAWWKHNFPATFYAVMLTVDPQQEQTYIIDAVTSGIKIRPPHVNKSGRDWAADEETQTIFMPLSAVKFLGESGVTHLIEERKVGGIFTSVKEFMDRVPKKLVRARAREGLFMLDGFSDLMDYPSDLEEAAETLSLKPIEPLKHPRKLNLKYLGFIVPDKRMLKSFESLGAKGWTCGIIDSREVRESRWGPYTVYRLSPKGIFWSRDVPDLEKGMAIGVNISEKNGKAKAIKIL